MGKSRSKEVFKALKTAFPYTIPILASFWFVGITYGVYMHSAGFNFVYPMLISLTVFGGSLEFVIVNMLVGAFSPFQTIAMALMIQARHLFYGISMLEKYKNVGWKKFFLIYGLCDETFSINYTATIPQDVDKNWFMLWVTILNQFYWVSGATIGGLVGSLLNFNLEGLNFVMTAMFVVIFLEQFLKEKKHFSSLIGLGASIICLVIFGSEDFLLPTMAAMLGILTILRKPIEKSGALQ